REQRAGSERIPHLLLDHHQLDRAETETPVGLRHDHPGPAELRELAPLLVGRTLLVLGQGAHGLGLVAGRQELLGRALDRLLIVGELEVHRIRGRPSTRSATMFLRISVVPPSIELARARWYRYVHCL